MKLVLEGVWGGGRAEKGAINKQRAAGWFQRVLQGCSYIYTCRSRLRSWEKHKRSSDQSKPCPWSVRVIECVLTEIKAVLT